MEMRQLMVLHRARNGHRRGPLPHGMAKHSTSYSHILPDQHTGWGLELILSPPIAPGAEQGQWPAVPACPLLFPCGCWHILEWGIAPTLGVVLGRKLDPCRAGGSGKSPRGSEKARAGVWGCVRWAAVSTVP